MEKLASEQVLTLEDVLGTPAKGRAAKLPPKYRNPSNAKQTWSGRGRKPKWVSDHLAAAGDLEGLSI